jgi:hypothetical protein
VRNPYDSLTSLQEEPSYIFVIVRGEQSLTQSLKTHSPYTGVHDDSPKEKDIPTPKQEEVLIAKLLPIPSKDLAIDPIPEPFLETLKDEEIHPLEFPFEFEEDLSPDGENTLNHPIQNRSLASLTPNHHLPYSSHDFVVQEPLKSTSSSTLDFNLPYVPPCFFGDNPNKGGILNLLVDVKREHKSSEVKIPIPMEDEDGNPLVECHRQEIMDEYVWSMDILEASNLESKKEDHVEEHERYILEEPQDACLHEKSPESIFPYATYTYEHYTHPMLLFYQILERMVVDAFVYHKYSKARSGFTTSSCS